MIRFQHVSLARGIKPLLEDADLTLNPGEKIGLIGANYLQAVGRNPEAAKFLGQALVFVGLVEVYGLLAFAATFFVK